MAQLQNTFASARGSQLSIAFENRRFGLLVATTMAVACALGLTIAFEKWLYVAAAMALLMLLVWPIELTVGLYALLLPFEPMTGTGAGSGPSDTLLRYVGLAALAVVPVVGFLRSRLVKPPRAALFWTLFVSWCGLSVFWAINQQEALLRLPTAVGLCLLYLGIVSVRITDKELSRIVTLCMLGGSVASLYAIELFLASGSSLGRASLVDGSTQADPNVFAATLLLPLSLAFGEVLATRLWLRRLIFLVGVGAMTIAIFLTMSRGALVDAAVIVIVFAARLRLNWRLLVPIGVLGAALLFMPSMFYERVQDVSHDRVSGRWDIWEAGAHSLTKYGVLGAGLSNFADAYQEFAGTARFYSGEKRASHNVYLTTSVELGIFGILTLFAALRSHFKELPRPARNSLYSIRSFALEAACWAMLTAGLSLDLLWNKAFWFVWALPMMAKHMGQEHDKPL